MSGAATALRHPFTEAQVRALHAGERVSIAGLVYTGRDRLHKHLAQSGVSPVDLRDGAIFHCGPVMRQRGGAWEVVSAGPTTSIREEPYMASIIAGHGVRVVIGKGGLGAGSLAAFAAHGCVYVQVVGGAAAVIAESVRKVENVFFLDEFGATEAMWALRVEGLEGVVAMDSHGRSLYDEVGRASRAILQRLSR